MVNSLALFIFFFFFLSFLLVLITCIARFLLIARCPWGLLTYLPHSVFPAKGPIMGGGDFHGGLESIFWVFISGRLYFAEGIQLDCLIGSTLTEKVNTELEFVQKYLKHWNYFKVHWIKHSPVEENREDLFSHEISFFNTKQGSYPLAVPFYLLITQPLPFGPFESCFLTLKLFFHYC